MLTAKQLQVLRLCASFGSCYENQHSNENRKFASDNDCLRKRIKAQRFENLYLECKMQLGDVSQLETVLEVYKADIIALQEMRWTARFTTSMSSYITYRSWFHRMRHSPLSQRGP